MKTTKSTLCCSGRFLGVVALSFMAMTSVRAANSFYETTVLNDSPLAFYPLDLTVDTGTLATDLSGNNNAGTYVNIGSGFNAVPGPTAFIPNATSFSGLAQYVDLGAASNATILNFSGPISIEAWVSAPPSGNLGDIMAKGNDSSENQDELELRCNGNNYNGGTYNNTTGSKGATGGTQSTNWTHLVISNDGTNWTLYVNGVSVQSNGDTVGAFTFNAPWQIGRGSADGASRVFVGSLSQVALYNHGLSSAQVLAHYFAGEYGVLPNNAVPIITQQPAPQISFPGGSATFSVTTLSVFATTNQWYLGGVPLVGQTNTTLSLSNLTSGGNYSVTSGNKNGTTNSVVATLTLKSLGVYATTVLGDSPIAYYPIDQAIDSGNSATDVSGNGNNAIFVNADPDFHSVTGPTSFITNAAAFNGQSYADMSTGNNKGVLNFGGSITMEAWVAPGNNANNLQNIIAKGYDSNQGYDEIEMREDGDHFNAINASSASGTAQNGVWTYLVSTCDGSTSKLYVNGQLAATAGSGFPNFVDPWRIGSGSSDGSSRFFTGDITEVALYNHVLTAGQVYNHYYAGVNGVPGSTVNPLITTQPVSQTVYPGSSVQFYFASLSAVASTNQWYKNGAPLVGQTNNFLTLLNVGAGDATTYYAAVGNANGVTNSTVVTLSLLSVTPPVAGNSLEWAANNNNGSWDNTSASWINLANSQQTNFNANDRALFDDTVGVPLTVTLNDAVAPSTVTNNSSANSYLINGGGKITGAGSFVKAGSSTLEIQAGNDFTGPLTVNGGFVKLDEPLTGAGTSYGATNGAPIYVTNGATLLVNSSQDSGIVDQKLIVLSGTGADGNGALQATGNDIYNGLFHNVLLTSDTLIGSPNRWDMRGLNGLASITTGGHPYNLSIAEGGTGTYCEWHEVFIDPALMNIDLLSGGNVNWYGMGASLGNPAATLTIHNGANLAVWHETGQAGYGNQDNGFAKNVHVMSGASYSYRPAGGGGDYHVSTSFVLEDGAGLNYFNVNGGNSTGVTFGGTVVFNGITPLATGDGPGVFTNVISGVGGFVWVNYNQTVTFTANDTYQGPTALGNGRTLALAGNGSISQSTNIFFGGSDSTSTRLDVSGRTDATLTLASGQTLGGIGRLNGKLVVSSGAIIAPSGTNTTGGQTIGNSSTGTISVTGTINLQNGSTTVLKLNGVGNNDSIVGINGAITYGGTLSLVNISASALVAGNSFQLFTAPGYNGLFANITPATPAPGLAWDTTQLSIGRLAVIAPGSSRPKVTGVHIAGNKLILSGANGPMTGNFLVLSSSSLATPLANWTVIATNAFNPDGTFGATNTIGTGAQQFYTIKEQ